MLPMDFVKIFGLGKQEKAKDKNLGSLFAALEDMLAGKSVDEIKLVAGWAGLFQDRDIYSGFDSLASSILSAHPCASSWSSNSCRSFE